MLQPALIPSLTKVAARYPFGDLPEERVSAGAHLWLLHHLFSPKRGEICSPAEQNVGRSSEISPSELHRATTATPLHLFVPACPKTTQIILFGCTPLHFPILLPSVLSSRPRFRTPCLLSFTAAASNPHSKLGGSLPRFPSFFFWDVRELTEAFTPR